MIFRTRAVSYILFLVFIVSYKYGMTIGNDSLQFRIETDLLTARIEDRCLIIPVILENHTNTNYLFFAFGKAAILDSSMDSIFYNDVIINGGAGTLAILLDENGKRKEVFFDIVSDDEPQNGFLATDLKTIESLGTALYEKGTLLVRKKKVRKVNLIISTDKISLSPGKYRLKLLYYAGRELPDVIGRSQMREKEKSAHATTFLGTVESNTISLELR